MATPIHCDVHDREHLADVLVSRLEDGSTMAACNAGYLELCMSIADQARAEIAHAQAELDAQDQAEADQEADEAAAAALARLDAITGQPDDAPGVPVSAEPGSLADRILAAGAGPDDDEDDDEDAANLATALAAERSHPDVTPAAVVRKGHSRSRIAHDARTRRQGVNAQPEPATADEGTPDPAQPDLEDSAELAPAP